MILQKFKIGVMGINSSVNYTLGSFLQTITVECWWINIINYIIFKT